MSVRDRSGLRSYEFRAQRERAWMRLEELVQQAEAQGIASLSAAELGELPALYRLATSSLSVARELTLDKNVLAYLESLTSRAYLCIYSSKRHMMESLKVFFLQRFPRLVYSIRYGLLVSAALLALGTACGLFMTLDDPDMFFAFVDPGLAGDRSPLSTREELREGLYHSELSLASQLTAMAAFLFSHNSQVGMLCFALGFLAGIPVFLLIFKNGLMLGAFWAVFLQKGLAVDFWLWVLPHGVTEMLAICLCGAAGLSLAYALLFPGRHTRLANLGIRGREAAAVVAGAIALLFVAALIEGFFRQLVTSQLVRLLLALSTTAFWLWYFLRGRRRKS